MEKCGDGSNLSEQCALPSNHKKWKMKNRRNVPYPRAICPMDHWITAMAEMDIIASFISNAQLLLGDLDTSRL